MREYEEKLKAIIDERGIEAEHLSFDRSCHSVAEAAKTVCAEPEDFVKSICMVDQGGRAIVAIVKGEDRASTSRVAKALGIGRPRVALSRGDNGTHRVPPGRHAGIRLRRHVPRGSKGSLRRRRSTSEEDPKKPW